jgi:hypothetical protein
MNIEINLKGEIKDEKEKDIRMDLSKIVKGFIWYKININTEEMKQK